jgi:hypothetical protein
VTAWTVELTHGRGVIDVDGDEVTTRQGDLWLLRDTPAADPPAVVLILARGTWRACYPSNTDPLPEEPPKPPARAMPVPPPQPDPLARRRW